MLSESTLKLLALEAAWDAPVDPRDLGVDGALLKLRWVGVVLLLLLLLLLPMLMTLPMPMPWSILSAPRSSAGLLPTLS